MNKQFTLTCSTGKRRYSNRHSATRALDAAWTHAIRGTQRSPYLPCRAYPCHQCNGFHLTSQPVREVKT